jgi:hypothetical protein
MSEAALQTLREQGAHLHDPVRFRYLEAMAARMPDQPAAVQSVLRQRFDAALADYRMKAEQAPHGASRQRGASCAVSARPSPLALLNRHIEAHLKDAHHHADTPGLHGLQGDMARPSDMKSVRRFSELWSRISAEHQLAQALTRGPEQAGPLNSHRLMLRAMSLMHGLSPDYLRRFLAQADALLWLDQMNQQTSLKDGGKAARRGRAKK